MGEGTQAYGVCGMRRLAKPDSHVVLEPSFGIRLMQLSKRSAVFGYTGCFS